MPRRKPGTSFSTGEACASFRKHLEDVRLLDPPARSWVQVEPGFLAAMEAFDAEVCAGRASEGERQTGKGDYFNELLAIIIEQASGVPFNRRRGVKGLAFADYNHLMALVMGCCHPPCFGCGLPLTGTCALGLICKVVDGSRALVGGHWQVGDIEGGAVDHATFERRDVGTQLIAEMVGQADRADRAGAKMILVSRSLTTPARYARR